MFLMYLFFSVQTPLSSGAGAKEAKELPPVQRN
jgi:hypothetical protein